MTDSKGGGRWRVGRLEGGRKQTRGGGGGDGRVRKEGGRCSHVRSLVDVRRKCINRWEGGSG